MALIFYIVRLMSLFTITLVKSNPPENFNFSSILVFGDSSVDSGNNQYLPCLPKANSWPYGIDLPGGIATGRFSNGRLVSDFIANALNIKEFVPPFLYPNLSDEELLRGVCFASAGGGIDEITGSLTKVLSLSQQIDHFKYLCNRLSHLCDDRSKYVFWDNAHLTQASYNYLASYLFKEALP
ncbi:unnamed protein product [Sphenostylis stenocarpa]|uniref:Uncharacterized protein n=1 Tax=Sphenostylis stenocarpa TaxID=92480 RepID=A0AA86SQU7_9FABA|nr:unnamed protein product [Sphenostylis stenocarpa]